MYSSQGQRVYTRGFGLGAVWHRWRFQETCGDFAWERCLDWRMALGITTGMEIKYIQWLIQLIRRDTFVSWVIFICYIYIYIYVNNGENTCCRLTELELPPKGDLRNQRSENKPTPGGWRGWWPGLDLSSWDRWQQVRSNTSDGHPIWRFWYVLVRFLSLYGWFLI